MHWQLPNYSQRAIRRVLIRLLWRAGIDKKLIAMRVLQTISDGELTTPGARARHQAGGGQALGGQEGLCAAAKALGGGTQFWLGGALQAPLKGLRASGFDSHWHALAGLRKHDALFSFCKS